MKHVVFALFVQRKHVLMSAGGEYTLTLSQGHTCAEAHATAAFTERLLFLNPTSVHVCSCRPGNKASAKLNL